MPDRRCLGLTLKITITKDGPYRVTGNVPLTRQAIGSDESGASVEWIAGDVVPTEAQYALCRCGRSGHKPFCDGTHAKVGFRGGETASRKPYVVMAKKLVGPTMNMTDEESLCSSARFCDRDGKVWKTVATATSPAEQGAFASQVSQCPSGRLVAWSRAERTSVEPLLPPSIALVEDPHEGVSGPLRVRGGVEIVAADGTGYEVRNRIALCRCGESKNKPFCDGSHIDAEFRDETLGG